MTGKRKLTALVLGIFVPVAVIIWFNSGVMNLKVISVGDEIPVFELPALGGGVAFFSDLEERTLLIFLSSECPSCIAELDCLEDLNNVINSNSLNIIVAFDCDLNTTASLFDQYPVFNQIAYNAGNLSRDLGIHIKPAFLFIGKNRILERIEYGYQDKEAMSLIISSF